EAHRIRSIAMQLDYTWMGDAGRLVQIVDVLGDDAGRLAAAEQAGQCAMPPPRPGGAKMLLHGKAPAPGFVARRLGGEKFVERDRRHAAPDAAGRAKVGYSAFSGDAGTGERHNHVGGRDESAQTIDGGLKIGGDHGRVPSVGGWHLPACTGLPKNMRW